LRNFKLVGLLVDGAEHGQEAGIGERGLVGVRGHLFDQFDGGSVVFELMLRGDQAHPCGEATGVVVENLLVEFGGLIVALGGHEDACVLQASSLFEIGAIVGEWQGEGLGQDALGVGVVAVGLIDGGEGAQVIGIAIEADLYRRGKAGHDGESLGILIVARVGKEQATPAVNGVGLNLEDLLVGLRSFRILLILCVYAGQAAESLRAARAHIECGLIFFRRYVELVAVKGLRSLTHGEPEARCGKSLHNRVISEAIFLGLLKVADRSRKVVLLHAQEAHTGSGAGIFLILIEHGLEASFGFGKMMGVQGGEGGSFGRRSGDAGVHFGELAFVGFEAFGEFTVFGMGAEIFLQLRGGGGVGRIPDERLTERILSIGIVYVFMEDLDAFCTGTRVVGQHPPEGDDEAGVAGIAGGCGAHGRESFGLAVRRGVKGFVVGEGDIAIGRMVAVVLAIDAHGGFRIAGLGERSGLTETRIAGLVAGEALNLSNVGVAGIDAAQLVECFIGGGGVTAQAIVASYAGERHLVVGVGEQDLLPDLDGDVGTAAGFEGLGFLDECFFGFAFFLGLSGCGNAYGCTGEQQEHKKTHGLCNRSNVFPPLFSWPH
jgi:hypothetical protein